MFRSTALVHTLALTLLLPLGSAVADEVYRHVDEDGNVTYSDEPMSDDSEAMELEPLPEVSLPKWDRSQRRKNRGEQDGSRKQQASYRSVEITQPEHDSTFWRSSGRVVVRIQSQPSLKSGHRYALEVDGERVKQGRSTSFPVKKMTRGTHELVVHVINANGETVSSSDVTRFTLNRSYQQN
ncbi:DUF4124 domain-containing protein [Halomonadaceae bacterium KBTZ08]